MSLDLSSFMVGLEFFAAPWVENCTDFAAIVYSLPPPRPLEVAVAVKKAASLICVSSPFTFDEYAIVCLCSPWPCRNLFHRLAVNRSEPPFAGL